MPLYPSLFFSFSTMSSFVYLYSLYVHMFKLYLSVFERLLSVFNVNCMHQWSESNAISILCMYVCHGAHSREEQGHAEEDVNSNNSL